MTGFARRHEERMDGARERRRGGARWRAALAPALLLSSRGGGCARFFLALRRRLVGGQWRGLRWRRRSLLLEPEVLQDVAALLLLRGLRARDPGGEQAEQRHANRPAASAHRRGTSCRWPRGTRRRSGRRGSAHRIA